MADDQQAEQIVEETPQATTPIAQETPEAPKEEVETSEEVTETVEEVKPRTQERIKKLTQELREAKERLQNVSPAIPEWYDPSTGVVDPNKLQQREQLLISELQTMKQQLSGYTKQSEVQQEKEAYAAYPELKSDDEFHSEVIKRLATEFALGNNPTMKEAADMVMGFAKKLTTKAEKDGARKALEQLAPKEQASLEATGRSDRRLPNRDLATLSRQSRYGGDSGMSAVLERLKHVPSV